jgi:IPT/TIG domain
MRSSLAHHHRSFPLIRVALVAALALLSSGWTCSAIFLSCQGVGQSQVASLSPDTIPIDAESVLLTAEGSGFTPESQIMWNGNALQTTFIDSHHLQTTVTQQTFDSFGGSVGNNVRISVRSQASFDDLGCPIGGNSATLVLVIN